MIVVIGILGYIIMIGVFIAMLSSLKEYNPITIIVLSLWWPGTLCIILTLLLVSGIMKILGSINKLLNN